MKKWTYLIAAGLLAGATPVFTGCIDNDEPAGISTLRGAMAELLQAKAVVEEANATYKLAQAEVEQAEARIKAAQALILEYQAEYQKLLADSLSNWNDLKKAEYEQKIAEIQQQMEEAELQHDANMLALQTALDTQKASYELIQKQIEIAKAVASDEAQVTIDGLELDVTNAFAVLFGGTYTPYTYTYTTNTTTGAISVTLSKDTSSAKTYTNDSSGTLYCYSYVYEKALEKAYTAKKNKNLGLTTTTSGTVTDSNKYVAYLEVEVEKQQAVVDAKQEALTKLQEYLEMEVGGTNWSEKIVELEEAIAELNNQISQYDVEIAEAKNSDSYIAAQQGVDGVYSDANPRKDTNGDDLADNPDDAISGGAYQVKLAAEKTLRDKKKDTELTAEAYEADTEVSSALSSLLNLVETDAGYSTTTDWTTALKYDEFKYKYWDSSKGEAVDLDVEKGTYPSDLSDVVEDFEYWLEIVNAATTDANAEELAKVEKTRLEALEKTYQDAYDEAYDKWEIAVAAYRDKTPTTVPTTDFQKVVTAYNTAYAALGSAITAYNNAFDDDYDAEVAAQELAAKLGTAGSLTGNGLDAPELATLAGFNLDGARTYWSGISGSARTESAFETAVGNYCSETGNYTGPQVKALALQYIDAYVATLVDTDEVKGTVEAGLTEEMAAVTDAVDAVSEAYGAIQDAIDEYKALAADPYGQVLTEAAAPKLTPESLAGNSRGNVNTSWYTKETTTTSNVTTETGHLVIANTEITSTEVSDATKTEIDTDVAKIAWANNSYETFGLSDRLVAASKEEVLAAGYGAAYDLYSIQDQIEDQQDIIDAATDLAALQAELSEDYDALIETIQADYNEAFATEIAAVASAQEDLEAALAVLDQEKEAIEAIELEQAKVQAQVNAQEEVKAALIKAVASYYGINIGTNTTITSSSSLNYTVTVNPIYDASGNVTGYTYTYSGATITVTADDFTSEMEDAILDAKSELAKAQQLLEVAQDNLKEAQENNYDEVYWAEYELAAAKKNYDKANEDYQTALENLAKALEIMAAE